MYQALARCLPPAGYYLWLECRSFYPHFIGRDTEPQGSEEGCPGSQSGAHKQCSILATSCCFQARVASAPRL